MVDLHCHILPEFEIDVSHGLPDGTDEVGAKDASLKACALAAQQGITHLVATPHIHLGRNEDDLLLVNGAVSSLEQKIAEAGLVINIFGGAEFAFSEKLPEVIENYSESKIAGNNCLLLEPYPIELFSDMKDTIISICDLGLVPILVHPERILEYNEDFYGLKDLVENGALIQITASHFVGWDGRSLQRACDLLLSESLVHFVASDNHFGSRRIAAMIPAWQRLVEKVGAETAATLTTQNPLAAIEGNLVTL